MENTNRTPLTLVNDSPVSFNPVGEVAMSTTNDLAKMINDIFNKVFDDYYGCNITVQFNPPTRQYVLTPVLYFKVLTKEAYATEGARFGFTPLDVHTKGSNVLGRVQRIANVVSTTGPKVAITDDMKDVMKDFVLTNNIDKFDWSTSYGTQVTGENTFVRMFKLDILKFLKFIFGDKDSNGGECYYQPTAIRTVISQQYGVADNWSISILRLNWSNEAYAAQQQGLMVTPMNAPANIITSGTV